MWKGPVAELLRHVTAQHADHQRCSQAGERQLRPENNQAEESDMQEYHDSPALGGPMPPMQKLGNDQRDPAKRSQFPPDAQLG